MKEVAQRMQVSVRTLRSWKAKARENCQKRSGRPRYTQADHANAKRLVQYELEIQGYPGSPAIAHALGEVVPLRLVRLYVKHFKALREKNKNEFIKYKRVSVRFLFKDAGWVQDGTHLGRVNGKAIEAQIIKDRGSLKAIGAFTGPSAKGSEVVEALDALKKVRGLPLVWITDNGSAYCNEIVQDYLKEQKVVHLRSMPRTPTDNAAAEVLMKELKNGSMIGKKIAHGRAETAHALTIKKLQRLNDHRLRASLEFKSASRCDEEMATFSSIVSREVFYNEYCSIKEELVKRRLNKRELRLNERELIMCLLEKYKLIKRTRGGRDHVV